MSVENIKKLTINDISKLVVGLEFKNTGKVTICVLTTESGYQIIGTSGTIDVDGFDEELGNKYAFQEAFYKLWSLEAYHVERVFRGQNPDKNRLREIKSNSSGGLCFELQERIKKYLD